MSNYYSLIDSVSPYLANLIAYYKFDANANDFSGNGYNGSIIGSGVDFPTGLIGNNIRFPNNNNNNIGVQVSDNDAFSFAGVGADLPFTISTWVKVNAFSFSKNPIFEKRAASNNEYLLNVNRLGGLFFIKYTLNDTASHTINTANGVIATGVRNHILITNRNSSLSGMEIYLNGNLLTSVTRSSTGVYTGMANGTAPLTLGLGASDVKLRGEIDEAYLWKNREMTATEALDIYNKGIAGQTLI